jgi:hypothetical protein
VVSGWRWGRDSLALRARWACLFTGKAAQRERFGSAPCGQRAAVSQVKRYPTGVSRVPGTATTWRPGTSRRAVVFTRAPVALWLPWRALESRGATREAGVIGEMMKASPRATEAQPESGAISRRSRGAWRGGPAFMMGASATLLPPLAWVFIMPRGHRLGATRNRRRWSRFPGSKVPP